MSLDRYLFRGICKETNRWVLGDLIQGADKARVVTDLVSLQTDEPENDIQMSPMCWAFESFPVIPETVGQWTGLLDKNGVKIFEGDNVRIQNYNGRFKNGEPDFDYRVFEVQWNQYTWAFNNALIYFPLSSYDRNDGTEFKFEIIGAIHDHLLGGSL